MPPDTKDGNDADTLRCDPMFELAPDFNRVDWVFGLATNAALSRHVAALEKTTAETVEMAVDALA